MKPSRVEFHRESIAQPTPCRARHYVHGKLNPLPNSQEWLNQIYAQSLVHFTLELQTMPQAHLSWYPTVLGFPYHSQTTWARTPVSPGMSPNHGLSTWKSVLGLPTQTTLSTLWMDVTSYMLCANMCLEAERELGKSVAFQTDIVYTLHSLIVADPTRPNTFLYIPCNCTMHFCIVHSMYTLHFCVVWTNIPVLMMSSTQSQHD